MKIIKFLLFLLISTACLAQHQQVTLLTNTGAGIYPVESWGAVGDWNGSTGTDNTAALQACVDTISNGVCVLQGKSYKVTGTVTITRSGVGIQGTCGSFSSATLYASPSCSEIVSTSASADIIALTGTSINNTIVNNSLKGFTVDRTSVPAGSAAGIRATYTYATEINFVVSEDSIYCFYFHGVGSQGTTAIENSGCSWGYNGVTETTGTLNGFYVDSANGEPSNSIVFYNDHVANSVGHGAGSLVSRGYVFKGTQTHDFQLRSPQTANTDYGLYLSCDSCSGLLSSTDMTMVDAWFDQCLTSAMYVNGILGAFMVVNGDFRDNTGVNAAIIDIENSIGVSMVNPQVFQTGSGGGANNYGILVNNSDATNIVSPFITNTSAQGINVNGSTHTNLVGIQTSCGGCTTVVSINGASVNATFAGGNIGGSATNGILIDSSSHGIVGMETVTINGPTNLLVDNATVPNIVSVNGLGMSHPAGGTLLCSPKTPTIVGGFNSGSVTTTNGSCSFSVTIGSGSAAATGTVGFGGATAANGWNCAPPFNSTNTGKIILETSSSTTGAAFTNYGTTPGTPVNWTNGDVINFICFAN